LGVSLRKESTGWVWSFPQTSDVPLAGTLVDVMEGIENLSNRPGALREWASFLIAASSLISLEELAKLENGEDLLEALWDLSEGIELEELLTKYPQLKR
jgi:hypothetical protein